MKAKMILFTVVTLFLLVGGIGCEEKNVSEYYEGKVTSLKVYDENLKKNLGSIVIQRSIKNGLPINRVIVFDPSDYQQDVAEGAVLEFKILELKDWQVTNGLFPDTHVYFAIIDLYNQ